MPSGARDCRPLPHTPILACRRHPPLRSGRFVLTKSNTSRKIRRPASLRSDGVHLRPGMVFGFPPEYCSAWPESHIEHMLGVVSRLSYDDIGHVCATRRMGLPEAASLASR